MQSTRTIRVYRSTCAAFFSSIPLCMRTEAQLVHALVHACLHKMYSRVLFEQEVLHVPTELNAIEITGIACPCMHQSLHMIFLEV